jgi:hypothetical protein
MRFRASLMAMRRISWIDQRISDGAVVFWLLPGGGGWFFWHRRIGAMSDGGHHGEGEHHQRDVTMPTMNRPGFAGGRIA